MSLIGLAALLAMAADVQAGQRAAAPCTVCHGANGISRSDMWPNLAGQKQGYLRQALQAYRSGARNQSMMSPQAKRLSDADIANLAAYFSSLPPK